MPERVQTATLTQHEPSDECADDHCHWHHVDEPIGHRPYYRICLECAHLYRTKRDLRRAYRNAERDAYRHDPILVANGGRRTSMWWRLLIARAARITFCQFCTHDL